MSTSPSDPNFWQGHSLNGMAGIYNEAAVLLDRPTIKRFESRDVAQRRLSEIWPAWREHIKTNGVPGVAGMAYDEARAYFLEQADRARKAGDNEYAAKMEARAASYIVTESAPAKADASQAETAATKEESSMSGKTIKELFEGVKISANRQPLLDRFLEAPGQYVPIGDLAQAVYGDSAKVGQLKMVIGGLNFVITKHSIPVEIRKNKTGKSEISFGIFKAA